MLLCRQFAVDTVGLQNGRLVTLRMTYHVSFSDTGGKVTEQTKFIPELIILNIIAIVQNEKRSFYSRLIFQDFG